MKEFFRVLYSGIQIMLISVLSTACFVSDIILYKKFIDANGFLAIGWFLVMIAVFVFGFMLLIFLGDVGRSYKNIIKKRCENKNQRENENQNV